MHACDSSLGHEGKKGDGGKLLLFYGAVSQIQFQFKQTIVMSPMSMKSSLFISACGYSSYLGSPAKAP